MRTFRVETALRLLLYGVMVAVSVIWLLRPLNDPDFFWHLKTGEWIWQHRELPASDPFNFTSSAIDPARQRFVLTSYWLSQVVYYGVHLLGGFPGIFAFKLLLAALFVQALVKLRRGDPAVHLALVLAALPLLYGLYPFDRPQVFSFLFFALLLILLEKERTSAAVPSGWGSYLPVPLLLLLWSNMHGGYVIGLAAVTLYMALEGLKFLHPVLRPAGTARYRRLLIVGAAGLFASLVNPNSYQALKIAVVPAPAWVGLLDYLPAVQFYREMQQPLILIFLGALALAALACLLTAAKPDITTIALLAGTGYAGFSHIRYVPFFMIAALPVIGAALSGPRAAPWARWTLAAAAVVLAPYFSRNELPSRARLDDALRVNGAIYPVQAADFVIANGLRGNLYNTYVWGGYLLWRLGPERKVFVDGRGINGQSTFQSASINMGFARSGESPPYWENLLRQQGIGHLIIPREQKRQGIVFEDTGRLVKALLEDSDWVPVHADEIALVFVANTPEHRDVIARHGIAKDRPLSWWIRSEYARGNLLVSSGRREEAVAAFREAVRVEPGNYEAWHNLGCVLGELGRLDEAAAAFEETLRLKPDHPTARKNLALIPGHAGRRGD